ncbi:MAG: LysR family transcriptional regulator [Gammaproteobacteria bacterium]|nr:LysR family transcriptional regulator [Gammaproteobacteria bacterium]
MMPNRYQFKYDLRQLRAFIAIAERLSFRRAADDLHIAQPALSRQIAQLEAALGCTLFNREKQRIRLTAAGEYLYRELPAALDKLQATAAQTIKVASGQTVSLKLGYSGAAMSSFLPALIRQIHQQLSDCEFEFVEETSDKLIEGVISGRLDTAFILYRPENPLLTTLAIRPEPIGLILPDDHPLAGRGKVALKALKNETLILFPRSMNPVMYDEIIAACQEAGFSPQAIREVAPRSIAIGLVAAGAGVATIASSLQHTCVKGTCYRPLASPAPQIRFSCITRAGQTGEWLNLLKDIIRRDLGA